MRQSKPLPFMAAILLILSGLPVQAEPRLVKVGVYDNKPLVFMGETGPEGLFIDVLEAVALEEEWNLDYRYASWEASFRAIQAGELDLLPVVAFSAERARMLHFSDTTLVANWGEIFTRRGLEIAAITDLQDRTIAYMEHDTHSLFFRNLLDTLVIDHASLLVESYTDMLSALEDGRADAGVFNHIQASLAASGRAVQITPIVFNPIQIRYASPKGDPAGLMPYLDACMEGIQSGDRAEYRHLINLWFGVERETTMPRWAWVVVLVGLAAIFLVLGLNLWLRNMVNKRTRDLQASNKALRESESRYRTILSSAMDGFLLANQDGIVIETNDIYCKMSGYPTDELVGMYISQLDAEESKELIREKIGRIRTTGSERFESRHCRKDRSTYDVELSIQYQPGTVEHFVTFVRDISHRKRIDGVRAFLAKTSGGAANAGFFHELAKYLGESLDMNYVFINTIDKDTLNASTIAVWHEGVFVDNISYPLKDTPGGETLSKDICTFPSGVKERFPEDLLLQKLDAEAYVGMSLRDHTGKPIGLIALVSKKAIADLEPMDSTLSLAGIRAAAELERLKGEQLLRRQAEYQRAIFDYSPLAMFNMDLEGRVVSCNAAAEEVFGWSSEELQGQRLPTIPAEKVDEFFQLRGLLLSGQAIEGLELARQKKDGTLIPVSLWSAPVYDANKTINGIISYYEDISKRRAIEERLKSNLEEKQILLREVHHRVKNNLSVISSLLNLQSATITSPEQALEAFRNSRDRIMAMALVHMELYESGNFARIDMGTYIGNLTRQIALVNENTSHINLVSHVEKLLLDLQAAVPCGLILNELITNAYKYASRDDRKVNIEVSMERTGDGLFSILVTDNGPGLPADYEKAGSLGLTLVRLLVGQIDGTMDMESSADGTTIRIRFPDPSLVL